jgi:hypothetical protein
MAVRTATARGKLKATRMPIIDRAPAPEPAGLDVMLGPVDGSSFQRLDVEVRPAPGGGLQIGIAVPNGLGPPVRALLLALGCGKGPER